MMHVKNVSFFQYTMHLYLNKTEKEIKDQAVSHLATHDPLTDLVCIFEQWSKLIV